MFRLAALLFSMIATAFAGSLIVVALATGHDDARRIILAAALGAIAAVPAAFLVARSILSRSH